MSTARYITWIVWLTLGILNCGFSGQAHGQSQQPPALSGSSNAPESPSGAAQQSTNNKPNADQRLPGRITGTVVDQTGAVVVGAWVRIAGDVRSPDQQVLTDNDGQFSFANITLGPFDLTVTAAGFADHSISGILHPGETYTVPPIALIVAAAATELRVVPSQTQVAEDQVKTEEKQRVFGAIPNFYVSYVYNAVPLTSKQKFQLAWKTTIDPFSFGLNGIIAGVQQSQNTFPGYGQGAQGYAKRYGASYADFASATFIGSAILPSLLKQDPRYFYKGTGRKRSRILYAIANAVICKGDNGHWQPNYSAVLGGLAASGVSNLYYPASDRNGAAFTFEQALIGTGATAATNLLQEFLIRKLIPGASNHAAAKSQTTSMISLPPLHGGD